MTDWKVIAQKNDKKAKYAWGQYFQSRDELFEFQEEIYNQVNEVIEDEVNDFSENYSSTNEHLIKFIRDLYKKAKASVECSICMEKIESDDLHTTRCGHNFHSDCITMLKQNASQSYAPCPICRSRIY